MPYWRLSNFYFFYFAALGALVPFWGLYLKSLGFGAVEIGQLMAILMATKIVAPNVWGWLADHWGHRMRIVRWASLASLLVFSLMFWADSFYTIATAMVLFSFFWNASLPQVEAVSFNYLGTQVGRYALIRLWGSVGFIVTVLLLGVLVDRQGPAVVISAVASIYLAIWLSSLLIPDPDPTPHPEDHPPLWTLLRRPPVIAFFAVVFLMQVGHGPYYAFYSIYMEQQGLSKTVIGQLWALGVLAEVGLFLVMHRVLHVLGARRLLVISLLIAALRWLLIGHFADSLWLMVVAQLLHAATFGSFHASAIHLVHHQFRGRNQVRGQALYSSLSFGAGGAVGALASGISWDALGATTTFAWAAGAAALGGWIAWRFLEPDR